MGEWNVVASIQQDGFRDALRLLAGYGEVSKTDYYNVLVLKVPDPPAFLEDLRAQVEAEPGTMNFLGRVISVTRTFTFHTPKEFEERASEAVLSWVPGLIGKTFHVRMHRRGLKGRLSSQEEEKLLAGVILDALGEKEALGRVAFEDPDAILAVETVGNRAGLSLWTREERRRYPFLGLD